ncbi:MAG TPA: hypothetical protein VKY37_01870 [Brumimicrobium sp.]|nr:hypothetical protein [Brumimicrobium sp.]
MQKKFIIKTLFFIVPMTLMFFGTWLFYPKDKGDLLRIGHLPDVFLKYPETLMKNNQNETEIYYTLLSSEPKKEKWKILVLGDSFTNGGKNGFQNILAKNHDVLMMDRYLVDWNPIETLVALTKGKFFEHYTFDYVILENVEREIALRTNGMNLDRIVNIENIHQWILEENLDKASNISRQLKIDAPPFFDQTPFTFFSNSSRFFRMNDIYLKDGVFKIGLNNSSNFSTDTKFMLCYKDDIQTLEENNKMETAESHHHLMNEIQEKLNEHNIQLISLIAPNKYTYYYDQIDDKNNYEAPKLLKNLTHISDKEYIYIDSYKVFKSSEIQTDIYFYDDSHWSPIGHRIIGEHLKKVIK